MSSHISQRILEETRGKLGAVTRDADRYKKMLQDLIVQVCKCAGVPTCMYVLVCWYNVCAMCAYVLVCLCANYMYVLPLVYLCWCAYVLVCLCVGVSKCWCVYVPVCAGMTTV